MTDERLEQILKQALSPEISDAEIEIRGKVRKRPVRKIVKAGVAAAAAVAVMVGAGFGESFLRSGVQRDVGTTKGDHSFVITAYGAEIGADRDLTDVIAGVGGRRGGWSGDPDTGLCSHKLGLECRCEGEDIAYITYSVKQGFFRIVEKGDSILVGVKDYEEERLIHEVGPLKTTFWNFDENTRYVTEYTLAGEAQSSDQTKITLGVEVYDMDIYNGLFPSARDDLKTRADAVNRMLEPAEITCTVYFTDGGSASKVITARAEVMTLREAKEGGILPTVWEEVEEWAPDYEMIFYVFDLK